MLPSVPNVLPGTSALNKKAKINGEHEEPKKCEPSPPEPTVAVTVPLPDKGVCVHLFGNHGNLGVCDHTGLK